MYQLGLSVVLMAQAVAAIMTVKLCPRGRAEDDGLVDFLESDPPEPNWPLPPSPSSSYSSEYTEESYTASPAQQPRQPPATPTSDHESTCHATAHHAPQTSQPRRVRCTSQPPAMRAPSYPPSHHRPHTASPHSARHEAGAMRERQPSRLTAGADHMSSHRRPCARADVQSTSPRRRKAARHSRPASTGPTLTRRSSSQQRCKAARHSRAASAGPALTRGDSNPPRCNPARMHAPCKLQPRDRAHVRSASPLGVSLRPRSPLVPARGQVVLRPAIGARAPSTSQPHHSDLSRGRTPGRAVRPVYGDAIGAIPHTRSPSYTHVAYRAPLQMPPPQMTPPYMRPPQMRPPQMPLPQMPLRD